MSKTIPGSRWSAWCARRSPCARSAWAGLLPAVVGHVALVRVWTISGNFGLRAGAAVGTSRSEFPRLPAQRVRSSPQPIRPA
jgi:hypothetical protein